MSQFGSSIAALLCLVTVAVAPRAGAAPPTSYCGTPLSADEVRTVARLSDTTAISGTSTLARLDDAVARNHAITDILVAHHDWRGLFGVGLDAVELSPVLPMQHDPAAFADPEYAHAVSYDLLRRYLANLHAEVTGGPVQPHWARYFELTTRCDLSPARIAMAGYNAHLTVDLAYAAAAVRSRPDNAPDFFRIVDAIARSGDRIIARTRQVYNADLGPLWRFYVVGDSLDRVYGRGVATGAMLDAADLSYNVVVYGNGLALQNPATAPAAGSEISTVWSTNDQAFATLSHFGGL